MVTDSELFYQAKELAASGLLDLHRRRLGSGAEARRRHAGDGTMPRELGVVLRWRSLVR